MPRRFARTAAWVLLLALGCGGGGASCGGCGAGCAMEEIPGGFPQTERADNAMRTKLSADGLRFIESQVQTLLAQQVGQLAFPIPCTDVSQSYQPPPIGPITLPPVTLAIHACDLNGDQRCTSADDDPSLRPDEPGHGTLCGASTSITGMKLLPGQLPNGDVDIAVEVNLLVNTGRIPLAVVAQNCGCSFEFDSDRNAPPTIPVRVHLQLKVNRQNKLLSWDLTGIDDIAGNIDPTELQVQRPPGASPLCSWVCDVSNVDLFKEVLFDRIKGMIYEQLRPAVDGARCLACTDGACPAGSNCHEDICYRDPYRPTSDPATDQRDCVEQKLGMEGRADLGSALGGFGGAGTKLDVSIMAGGLDPDGSPSTKAQAGGVVVGVMGGTLAATRSACVPMQRWQPRLTPIPALDFDAEARTAAQNGTALTGYHLGFSIADDYLDRAAFEAWGAGALCIDLSSEAAGGILTTGLFKTFLGSLDLLTHKQDSPMLVSLRPRSPPQIRIGKGTTKPGAEPGTRLPDDALLTIEMKDLNVDFYAFIEERQVRLFTLIADLSLPLALEFDATAKTVTPVLGGLETLLTNVRAANNELLAEDPDSLVSVLSSIIGLAGGPLAGGLGAIEMPALQGMELQVLDARGASRRAAGDHDHLALFLKLALTPPAPYSQRFDTSAKLVSLAMPPLDALRFEGARPAATIDVAGLGATPLGFAGFEYSWRVDGDLWRPWEASSRLVIAAPQLVLEGRHLVEVRAREAGVMESADRSPASVVVTVDYTAPELSLVPDAAAGLVRVVAHDRVAQAEELTMRVRTTGDWSAPTALRDVPFGELDGDVLEVEVRDPAGFLATAKLGSELQLTEASPLAKSGGSDVPAAGGCAEAAGSLVALSGLVALLRRRRS